VRFLQPSTLYYWRIPVIFHIFTACGKDKFNNHNIHTPLKTSIKLSIDGQSGRWWVTSLS
jgi:hypothetical protein